MRQARAQLAGYYLLGLPVALGGAFGLAAGGRGGVYFLWGGVALAMLAASLLVIVLRVASAVRTPTIRLVSSKQPPELQLGSGLTWHLFNSHIW